MSATNRGDYERRVIELAEQFRCRFERRMVTSTTLAEIAAFETYANKALRREFPHESNHVRVSFYDHSHTAAFSIITNKEQST